MLDDSNFVFLDGIRYLIKEDEKPNAGDNFIYERKGLVYFGTCEGRSSDGSNIIRECSCGECKPEDRYLPIDGCTKIVPSPIEYN